MYHVCMYALYVRPSLPTSLANFSDDRFRNSNVIDKICLHTWMRVREPTKIEKEPLVNGLMCFVIDCNTFTSPSLTCHLTFKLSNWSLLFISDTCPDGVRLDRNPVVAKHCLRRSALATDRGAGRLAGPRRVVKAGRGRGGRSTESGASAPLSVERPRGDSSGRPPPSWFESGNVCRPNRQKGWESAIEATHSKFG